MKAIILAAGQGKRIKKIHDLPKGLIKFGKKKMSIINRLCSLLEKKKIKKIIVITGFKKNALKQELGKRVKYIYSPNFKNSNNLQSLLVAKKELNESFLCFFADLVFDEQILNKVLLKKSQVCLAVDTGKVLEGTMRIKKKKKYIVDIGSHIPVKYGDGNFIGISKFSKKAALELKKNLIKEKKNKIDYYTQAIRGMIKKRKKIEFVDCKNSFWKEIDTYRDLCDMKDLIKKKKFKYQ